MVAVPFFYSQRKGTSQPFIAMSGSICDNFKKLPFWQVGLIFLPITGKKEYLYLF
jgi:hypothetical protein